MNCKLCKLSYLRQIANNVLRCNKSYSNSVASERQQYSIAKVLFDCFQDKGNSRKKDLEDSVQTQQYLSEASEAESWLTEKEPIVCSIDYGKDEDTSQVT